MRLPGSKGAVSVAARMLNKCLPRVSNLEPRECGGSPPPGVTSTPCGWLVHLHPGNRVDHRGHMLTYITFTLPPPSLIYLASFLLPFTSLSL